MEHNDIIKNMQLCTVCDPFFDRTRRILAHKLGLHVKIQNGIESVFAPLKGHELFDRHLTAINLDLL